MSSAPSILSLLPQLQTAAQADATALASMQQQLSQAKSDLAAAQAQLQQQAAAQLTVASPTIAPGTDLGPILAKSPAGATIYLKPGASYVCTGAPAPATGVSLIGFNTSIVTTPVPTGSTGIAVRNPNCTFSGLNFIAAPGTTGPGLPGVVALHIWAAGTQINGCNFDATLTKGIETDVGGDNTTVNGCNFGITQAQGIYGTADNLTVNNCVFAGSVGEHPIRIELNGTTKHRSVNVTINRCIVTNHNAAGKETIAIRECVGFTILDTIIDGWLDLGQGNTDTNVHASGGYVRNLTIRSLRPQGALIQIRHDVDCVLANITAPGAQVDPLFSADDRATVWLRNQPTWTNTPAPGQQWKLNGGTGKVVQLA